jgi:hypothetical protein
MQNGILDGLGPHNRGPEQQQFEQNLTEQQVRSSPVLVTDALELMKNMSRPADERFRYCGCPVRSICNCSVV